MGRINRPRRRPRVLRLRSADVAPELPDPAPERAAQQRAVTELAPLTRLLTGLGERFASAGHELALVGGPVRDALLGRLSSAPDADLDFTTDARPEVVLDLLAGYAETTWDVGIRFGTVGARLHGRELEITTYRAEQYDLESRKPQVDFGHSLDEDLARRDFTINAMALRLPDMAFVDLFGGQADLAAGLIRTPGTPEESFGDDPLRMMRAARFAAQLGFTVRDDVLAAMAAQAERLSIVSAERIREEFMKIVMSPDPRRGLTLLVDSGLAEYVLPELPLLRLEEDEHHHHKDVYEHTLTVLEQAMVLEEAHEPRTGPDPVLRLAALLHDIGKPRTRRFESDGRVSFHHHEVVGARMTRKRMQQLRFSNELIDDVSTLVELHLRFHGYGSGEWTDSAVRRYVRDAGPLVARLHKLTRADSTTRNRRRAVALQRSYDSLEQRIRELEEQEELASIRPDLDGRAIMEILGIPPGPMVGEAYTFLLELRLDRGPMDEAMAREALQAWWAARP
jgi:poly(A) polymerase